MKKNTTFARWFLTIMLALHFMVPAAYGQPIPENIIETFHYRSIGPTRQGGRTVDFAVPRQLPYTFYAATASGGLWKTVNNGQSFEPVFDNENVIALGFVAVAPSDPDVIWAGTGEPNNSDTDPGLSYWGDGVYKSVDGGKSWHHMGLTESHYSGGIVIHPNDPNIVYAAALGHFFSDNSERGLYKTTDGGRSWIKSLSVTEDGRDIGVIDIVMDTEDPNTLYVAAWDKQRLPWRYIQSGTGSGIYKTTDAGKTWKKLTNGLPQGKLGRIGLDLFRKDTNILYAAILEGKISRGRYDNTSLCTVYRTDDGGGSWRQVSSDDAPPQGGSYYGQIRVDPNDEDHVYLLSTIVQESRDGGKTWERAWTWAGDNHALWIDPDDSRHMLLGYDFGFSITYDGGKNWYHPDNLPLAYLYAVGVDMSYPYNVYGGTQDNGGWKGPSTKKGRIPIRLEDWEHVVGGDGFYHQIDPVTNRYLYNESQWGEIQRVDLKTGKRKWLPYRGGIGEDEIRLNWNTPILISPHNSDVIYHGSNFLMRSDYRGENWYKISPDLTTNDPEKTGVSGGPMYCTITTIDESPVNKGVIWVGTDDGNVQLTTDGGKSWTRLNDRIPGNPEYYVSRVTASNHDAGTAYVTYTGRRRDDFRAFVFKTTDFGKNWESIVNNLPEESVNVIKEDRKNPSLLFVGTDKAVYVTIDGGSTWTKMQNNMPVNPVHDLLIHPRENDLVVGTHGRGFFITDISPLQELDAEVLARDVHLFGIEPKVQWVMPRVTVQASQNYYGENEKHGVVVNYYLKETAATDVLIEIYKESRRVYHMTGPESAGLQSVEWTMISGRERSGPEKERWIAENNSRGPREASLPLYDSTDSADPTQYNDPNYIVSGPVPAGEYTVVLTVNGTRLSGKALIIPDYWYDK
jgi:photosystem II stability/assembly factor-like uncharacterized protein